MLGLYREHYANFTVKHFGTANGSATRRLRLVGAGEAGAAAVGAPARSGRAGRCRACCCTRTPGGIRGSTPPRHLDLVVTLDDATSEVYSAFLVEEEGTASSFRGLAEVVAAKGLFCALYTYRGSHYFLRRRRAAGRCGSSASSTSPRIRRRRAAAASAPSPTLQDRLPKEL